MKWGPSGDRASTAQTRETHATTRPTSAGRAKSRGGQTLGRALHLSATKERPSPRSLQVIGPKKYGSHLCNLKFSGILINLKNK